MLHIERKFAGHLRRPLVRVASPGVCPPSGGRKRSIAALSSFGASNDRGDLACSYYLLPWLGQVDSGKVYYVLLSKEFLSLLVLIGHMCNSYCLGLRDLTVEIIKMFDGGNRKWDGTGHQTRIERGRGVKM